MFMFFASSFSNFPFLGAEGGIVPFNLPELMLFAILLNGTQPQHTEGCLLQSVALLPAFFWSFHGLFKDVVCICSVPLIYYLTTLYSLKV